MTSREHTNESVKSLEMKNIYSMNGGSMHEDIEINDEYLDEILQKNYF